MLSQKDLVARLKQYEFSKLPDDVKDTEACGRECRAHGIGNMLRTNLEQTAMAIIEIGSYRLELVDVMYAGYGFIRTCYDTIDFKELEDHKDEPAVNILFKMNELLPRLGRAIDTFATSCARTQYTKERITERTEGYQELIGILREIRNLDEEKGLPGAYKKRVEKLEAELAE